MAPCSNVTNCSTDVNETTEAFSYELPAPNSDELQCALNEMVETSAKEEFIRTLQENLAVKVAKQKDCNKVFETDSAADLAVTLMTGKDRNILLPPFQKSRNA